MPKKIKTYLGDAVYAEFDGFGVELTTTDGMTITNVIYLEPFVLERLVEFCKNIQESNKE